MIEMTDVFIDYHLSVMDGCHPMEQDLDVFDRKIQRSV